MKTNSPAALHPPLFTNPALRAVTGATIRPGGLTLTARALALCRLPAGAAVLDVGCGNGATLRYLQGAHGLRVVGVDLCAALLAEGRGAEERVPLIRGDAQRLPLRPRSLAAVFMECVLSLTADPVAVLAEAGRVLQSGGWLIISDLYRRGEAGAVEHPAGGCLNGAVPQTVLQQRVRRAGFELVCWEEHTPLLKRLAADLVWTYGSLQSLPGRVWAANPCNGGGRPGYGLLIARREASDG